MPPRRGTVDFMAYAVDTNELFPPYWRNQHRNAEFERVDVWGKRRRAIIDLVRETWEEPMVRRQKYSHLVVLDVERVENCELFSDYRRARRRLMKEQIEEERTCDPIGGLRNSRGNVVTTDLLSDSMECLKRDLYLEVNEHYLFHGTPVNRIGALISNGFDVNHSNPDSLFGQGIYAGENSSIADFHAGERNFTDPPRGYDSVMVDGRWRHREFIVYDDSHVYPEYVITYTRE